MATVLKSSKNVLKFYNKTFLKEDMFLITEKDFKIHILKVNDFLKTNISRKSKKKFKQELTILIQIYKQRFNY